MGSGNSSMNSRVPGVSVRVDASQFKYSGAVIHWTDYEDDLQQSFLPFERWTNAAAAVWAIEREWDESEASAWLSVTLHLRSTPLWAQPRLGESPAEYAHRMWLTKHNLPSYWSADYIEAFMGDGYMAQVLTQDDEYSSSESEAASLPEDELSDDSFLADLSDSLTVPFLDPEYADDMSE